MQKPETKFINKLHKLLNREVYRWKIHDSYTSGIPDCYYSGPCGDLWIEHKWYPNDRKTFNLTSGKKPKLSRLQQYWLNERLCEGRNVRVIVGFPSGGIILTNGDWNNQVTPDGKFLTIREVAEAIENECSYSD